MEIHDVQHLAGLARISLADEEASEFAAKFDAILSYVAQITEVSADAVTVPIVGVHANVFREDVETNEPGAYTETLISAAPKRNRAYIQVKKIFGNKR